MDRYTLVYKVVVKIGRKRCEFHNMCALCTHGNNIFLTLDLDLILTEYTLLAWYMFFFTFGGGNKIISGIGDSNLLHRCLYMLILKVRKKEHRNLKK